MNQYGSLRTQVTLRGLALSAINPPNDYTLPFSYLSPVYGQIALPGANANSSIILHGLSVKSNFADGLVWKEAYSRLRVGLSVLQYTIADIPAGTVSGAMGTQVIMGVGTAFNVDLVIGQPIIIDTILYTVLAINGATEIIVDKKIVNTFAGLSYWRKSAPAITSASYGPASKIVTVVDATNILAGHFYIAGGEVFYTDVVGVGNFTAIDYPHYTNAVSPLYNVIASTPLGAIGTAELSDFNTPIDLGYILNPTIFGNEGADGIIVRANLGTNFDTPLMLTKSINTAFAGDNCIFDVDLDVEYTL